MLVCIGGSAPREMGGEKSSGVSEEGAHGAKQRCFCNGELFIAASACHTRQLQGVEDAIAYTLLEQNQQHTPKYSSRIHAHIACGSQKRTLKCASGRPRQRGRVRPQPLDDTVGAGWCRHTERFRSHFGRF